MENAVGVVCSTSDDLVYTVRWLYVARTVSTGVRISLLPTITSPSICDFAAPVGLIARYTA